MLMLYFCAASRSGRLTGVVSPETVDEVAKRVVTLGTEPEAPSQTKTSEKGGKK